MNIFLFKEHVKHRPDSAELDMINLDHKHIIYGGTFVLQSIFYEENELSYISSK
jgi:hypothetical protein